MNLLDLLPTEWRAALTAFLDAERTAALGAFVAGEYAQHTVYPPIEDLFAAYRLCPPEQTRVLILGQDPYHGAGQAHGLSFSVREGVRIPPSLRNVFKELAEDIGVAPPAAGDLTGWARQGVLLLNASLTVEDGAPQSHAGRGWELLADALLARVAALPAPVVFMLWGASAQKKRALVEAAGRHRVLAANHPSPLSALRPPVPFIGSRPFTQANALLAELRPGTEPIRW
jgi:uracil-DNA glycosylase